MLYYKSTTLFACGKRGIRTLGTRRYNGFRDRPDRPLRHLSNGLLFSRGKGREKNRVEIILIVKKTKTN